MESNKKIKLPPHTFIGNRKDNGLMIGGRAVFSGIAQIFLECNGGEKKCHDTIALLPNRNAMVDANTIVAGISDKEAGKVFDAYGWLVKGYNNDKYTRCPVCAKKVRVKRTVKTNLIIAILLNMSNDRFDTSKPILESLFDHAQNNFGKLEDHYFDIAIDEYNTDEDTVMQEMMDSKEYKFTRYATGWNVKSKR